MKKLSELSLADLIALYSKKDGYGYWISPPERVQVATEIQKRISEIDFNK